MESLRDLVQVTEVYNNEYLMVFIRKIWVSMIRNIHPIGDKFAKYMTVFLQCFYAIRSSFDSGVMFLKIISLLCIFQVLRNLLIYSTSKNTFILMNAH